MTFVDTVNTLIGKPYDAQYFHCWTLVELLLPYAPKVQVTAANLTVSVKEFKDRTQATNLKEVTDFGDKDIIVLGRNEVYHHAGVFFNGGIIHVDKLGTRWQLLSDMAKVYPSIKGFRK